MNEKERTPSLQSQIALDWVAFCVTDIANGLGAFTATYLQSDRHWDPAKVGTALSAAGVAALVTQLPAAALLDVIVQKKKLLIYASLIIAVSALGIIFLKSFAATVVCEAIIGSITTFVGPAIAAISLGLVGHAKLDQRIGRTSAYSHAGNVVAAIAAGWLGFVVNQGWVFYLIAILNVATAGFVLIIRTKEIDFDLSRGGDGSNQDIGDRSSAALWKSKIDGFFLALQEPKMILVGVAFFFFQLVGAGILPLVGQNFGQGASKRSALYMAAAIIMAQIVMVPVCWVAGRVAQKFGRKKLLLIALGCVPLRALLCGLTTKPLLLVLLQSLDGVSAGLFFVVSVLMIADLTKGTDRFNSMQGFAAMSMSLGAALSVLSSGYIAKAFHFSGAFFSLAAGGVLVTILFYFLLPETQRKDEATHSGL